MVGAIVNDTPVSFDYILQNKDRVKILTDSELEVAYIDVD